MVAVSFCHSTCKLTAQTPYLTTTLPKPELLVDTSMQGGQKVDDEEDDRDEMDVDEQRAGRRLARPHGGEIAWWMTAVGFEKSKVREDEFGWADTGGELL
jgi:hypothetical protein